MDEWLKINTKLPASLYCRMLLTYPKVHREKKLYEGEEGRGYFLAWRKINGKVIFLFLNRMRNMCVCVPCIFSRIYYEGKSIFESCEALLFFGSFGITQGK